MNWTSNSSSTDAPSSGGDRPPGEVRPADDSRTLRRGAMEKAPNFMVVGAAKAGTTSLYHYLQQHPDVFMPVEKEPHHFSQVRPDPAKRAFYKHIPDRATYLAL